MALGPEDAALHRLVLLGFRDDGGGRALPTGATIVRSAPGVLARLDGRLHLFTEAGARTLRERTPPEGPPPGPDVSVPPAFEFDRFTERRNGGVPLAVAAEGGVAWLVERDASGRPRLVRYDGVGFTRVPWPADGPIEARGAAARPLGADRTLVAVRDRTSVSFLMRRGETVVGTGRVEVGPGGDGLAMFPAADGASHVFATVDGEEGRRLVRVPLGAEGTPAAPRAASDRGIDGRLIGSLPARFGGDAAPRLVIASGGAVRAVRTDGAPDEAARPLHAAWSSQRTRFEYPLFAQIALFTLVGSFARRPRPRRREERPAAGREDVAAAFAPAPVVRRILAAVFDLGLATTALLLVAWAADASSVSYVVRTIGRAGTTAVLRDSTVFLLLLDLQYLGLMLWFAMQAVAEASMGRSLGKRLFGLRVVGVEGGRVSVPAALTRSVLLFLDVVLTQALLGALLVLFTRRRQRLGDLLAGTMVVDARLPVMVVARGGPAQR